MAVPMATTQDFVNWVCGPSIRPEYLLDVFRAMRHEFARLSSGSTHQTIYMPDVGRFATPLPPLREQDDIVSMVRQRLSEIDASVSAMEKSINFLREYRSALITAAVTGQIDMRRHAP
jgi:type I restriction enzyme S subunit